MKSILDPSFHYTSSVDRDLRKSFARIRRQRRKQVEPGAKVNPDNKILPMFRKLVVGAHKA
jgi:hypothetical protein